MALTHKYRASILVWAEATGDGKTVSSIDDIKLKDYVYVRGTQSDDDNDSYVNVKTDQSTTINVDGICQNL